MKTLLIGIDAACAGVLSPLFDDGALPNLRRVFDGGVAGPLESHVPPWTPSMWPSLYTGVNPGKHGVFGFLSYEGYDWDVVDATQVREHGLWELLDENDLSSVVVNVPVTDPPRPFDGALVPGYLAPEPPRCHPTGLLDELRAELGEYRIYPRQTGSIDAAREEYLALVRMRGRAFRHLCATRDPDFGFVQFQVTDTVFHEHPDELSLVDAIYRAVDEEVGTILDAFDPETVIVASDHGMGRYGGYGVRVNELLADHGFVRVTDEGPGMPSWVPIRDGRLRSRERPRRGSRWFERCVDAATAVGVTPRRVGRALERVGLRETVASVVPDSTIRAHTPQVDFPASTAYMRARIELGVRINLAGREPRGVVAPDEYETVRQELIDVLRTVETPDGDPVFETVAPREWFFDGPYADEAVDVITIPTNFDHFLTATMHGEPFGEPGQPWNHKRTGLFAAAGSAIDPAGGVDGAHIFDVAPTVLATLGVEWSDRMDGRPLPIVEDPGHRRYAAYESTPRSSRPDEAVVDRLADIGYLDRS